MKRTSRPGASEVLEYLKTKCIIYTTTSISLCTSTLLQDISFVYLSSETTTALEYSMSLVASLGNMSDAMKSPENSKMLPWVFANLQRTLEPNFTYSTLERVSHSSFEISEDIPATFSCSSI